MAEGSGDGNEPEHSFIQEPPEPSDDQADLRDDPLLPGDRDPTGEAADDDQRRRISETRTGLERREVVHGKRRNADYVRVQYSGRRQFRHTGGERWRLPPRRSDLRAVPVGRGSGCGASCWASG